MSSPVTVRQATTGPGAGYTHLCQRYQLNIGQSSCTGPGSTSGSLAATLNCYQPTGQGVAGRWTGDSGGGCVFVLHFAAVLDVNH